VNQEQSALIMLGLMTLALAGAWWGWRRRRNEYVAWAQHFTFWDEARETPLDFECWYVGTSEAGLPLQRVAVGPLSYRAKATLGLHATGLVFQARGSQALVFPADAQRGP
jgi:LPXTG-motif cell wall-anchored protein